ncbi:hypothetical protein [Psychrobacter sp. M13]|uniref:hypothetical protein n=1 Tax=Psychrobacter sp. M13 TaxID=3067275 RepID=UPI00273C92D0|nr:hypothetical protein [Psychrobacter sp. M13]WLP95024.1 hypothetical protein Q9G97_02600 [Psychrobacter sp. M13]
MKYIFAFFCCFILSSCATIPDQAYHPVDINPVTNIVIKNGFKAYLDDNDQLDYDKDIINKTSFSRFYLEYNEDGKKFEENKQLNLIKNAIDTSDKPVYLVVYVHGWNNNANTDGVEENFDTEAFPYLLARRSFQNPDMNVIGVYVGWRGAKYKYRPAHFLTPLDRARAADFIGEKGEVRDDLIELTNHVEKSTHSGYSLIMGHSFGGRLLSRAFIDDLANTKSIADWPLGKKSLLANLNPAIGADAFDKIYSDIPGRGESLQRPLWINLTSEDDNSTKTTFPRARFLLQDLTDKPYSGVNDTVGHYMPYLSHWVTSAGGIVGPVDNNNKNTEADLINCKFEDAEVILKDNKPWFEIPTTLEDCATRHLYENKEHGKNEFQYYTTGLWPFDWATAETAKSKLGYMWNFQVDDTLIDHSETEEKASGNGPHNAFVQTILGRMLDDMLFTPPEKPLD